ncbi:MAG: rhodanese-like domain-containing protein [Patescibacteria group bacterium]
MSQINKYLLTVAGTFIFTLLLIYGTPLRYTDMIEPTIKDIDGATFYEKFSKDPDNYIFIDVRGEDAYNQIHAKGSVNKPLHTLYDERKILPKKGKDIVLICSGGRASGVAYSYLQHYGFTNMVRIDGGIEKWIELGLPTESNRLSQKTEAIKVSYEQIQTCIL